MGRYVYSKSPEIEYNYKFSFAEQPSNFGELLEDHGLETIGVTRYLSDSGEYVELFVDDVVQARKELEEMATYQTEEYNARMIKELYESFPDELPSHNLTFFVEY